jgi:GNAT superfamily N-acetyltransferase
LILTATRIELVDGADSWKHVDPLENIVYPAEILEKIVWRDVQWAYADKRVLVWDDDKLLCHVGVYLRSGLHDGKPVRIAGIGGVQTHPTRRREGIAARALGCAAEYMHDEYGCDFGLLFCEPHNDAFYQHLGWKKFDGTVLAEQRGVSAPFTLMGTHLLHGKTLPNSGTIDLCGLPW